MSSASQSRMVEGHLVTTHELQLTCLDIVLRRTIRQARASLSRRSPTSSVKRYWRSGHCEKSSSCSISGDIAMYVFRVILHIQSLLNLYLHDVLDHMPLRYGYTAAGQFQRDISIRRSDLLEALDLKPVLTRNRIDGVRSGCYHSIWSASD